MRRLAWLVANACLLPAYSTAYRRALASCSRCRPGCVMCQGRDDQLQSQLNERHTWQVCACTKAVVGGSRRRARMAAFCTSSIRQHQTVV